MPARGKLSSMENSRETFPAGEWLVWISVQKSQAQPLQQLFKRRRAPSTFPLLPLQLNFLAKYMIWRCVVVSLLLSASRLSSLPSLCCSRW